MTAKNGTSKLFNDEENFDGGKDTRYPLGNKPSGYQTVPTLIDTDIISGSLTGGEDNKGAYMSLYGYNLGRVQNLGTADGARVYFRDPLGDNNWHEVDNYRSLRKSLVFEKLQVVEIIVQIGALGGGMTNGRELDIKVDVAGTDTNILEGHFTIQPGRFWFVDNVAGDDATGLVNDMTKPFRYLQNVVVQAVTFGGLWATTTPMGEAGLRAGDTIVLRDSGTPYSDQTGYGGRWCRFRLPAHNGSAPNGTTGNGFIHITAYPGGAGDNAPEVVHYIDPAGGKGGIHGVNTAYVTTSGTYVSISRLKIECSPTSVSDAAPINLQNGADHWRVYGNELGPWESTVPNPAHARAGGVAGQGFDIKIKFNYIHDIWCNGASENHGIYVGDTGDLCSSDWDMSYNWIFNIPGGNSVQWNNNAASDTFDNMAFHHNWCEDNGKYSVNVGNSITNLNVYNNVLINPALAILRFDVCPDLTVVNFVHNTCIQKIRYPTISAMTVQTWGNQTAGAINIKHNIFVMTEDHDASLLFTTLGAGDTAVDMSENLYYDLQGTVLTAPALDATAIYGDPSFTDITNGDYTCQADGAGVEGCTEPEEIAIADDAFGFYREVTDTSTPTTVFNDIGATQGVGT